MLAYLSNLINLRKRGAYRTKENVSEQPDRNKYRIQLERDFWNTKRTSLRRKYKECHHHLSNNVNHIYLTNILNKLLWELKYDIIVTKM